VLLCSVFGPFARDDEYGSRALNPMELYHNQVTRLQGPFSLRMFHRSWGIMLIQANIKAPCALLDFPTLDRFVEEISQHSYDIVGISAIIPNMEKVKKMCALIRSHLPNATIVVGGHVANLPNLHERIDADHVVRGEGVRWFRRFLSEPEDAPIRHPRILSGSGCRTMGIPLSERAGDVAATLLPSVGCPMGCNFCSTSSMFGGKGNFVNFYNSGDELFDVMEDLERDLRVRSFFVMDENFLLHKRRALRLLELMEKHNKAWSLYVFSSANVLRSYKIEQLVGLGISWLWMGLEGKDSEYQKLKGVDTFELVRTLQSHGIRVLGSSIIGLAEHTPENLPGVIEYAVSHDTDFHQFMLYTPLPGTPLFGEHQATGTLLDPECTHVADMHGQLRFFHKHPNIPPHLETKFLLEAFERDFRVNGPSVLRIARTTLMGWRRYCNHSDRRIRSRFEWEAKSLATTYAGALWAARNWFKDEPALEKRIDSVLFELRKEFGFRVSITAPLLGRVIRYALLKEDRRLKNGMTYEPPTFYECVRIPAAPTRQAETDRHAPLVPASLENVLHRAANLRINE
jgi:radical SAM superfamily enzyme YgiQ (UPF0313 family)